jgi:hypothetical protein
LSCSALADFTGKVVAVGSSRENSAGVSAPPYGIDSIASVAIDMIESRRLLK